MSALGHTDERASHCIHTAGGFAPRRQVGRAPQADLVLPSAPGPDTRRLEVVTALAAVAFHDEVDSVAGPVAERVGQHAASEAHAELCMHGAAVLVSIGEAKAITAIGGDLAQRAGHESAAYADVPVFGAFG